MKNKISIIICAILVFSFIVNFAYADLTTQIIDEFPMEYERYIERPIAEVSTIFSQTKYSEQIRKINCVEETDYDVLRTIYVDNSAGGLNNGTSWANAYISLQAALQELDNEEGVMILIAEGNGPYEETFCNPYPPFNGTPVDNSDSGSQTYPNIIKAKEGEQPVISPAINSFDITGASWITIDGLVFQFSPAHYGGGNYINIINSAGITVKNCIIQGEDPCGNGITIVYGSQNIDLDNNQIYQALNGIIGDYMSNLYDISVKRCTIYDAVGNGIVFLNVSQGEILNNVITGSGTNNPFGYGGCGMRLENSEQIKISNNVIDDSLQGINPIWNGIGILLLGNSSSVEIKNNIVKDSQNHGIYVEAGCSADLSYNDFFANEVNYYGIAPGYGDINVDPLFVSENYRNYHLHPISFCIDMGDPDNLYDDLEDPANPGMALYPSLGTILNDMGAYGGPYAYEADSITITLPLENQSVSSNIMAITWETSGISPNEDLRLVIKQHNGIEQKYSSAKPLYQRLFAKIIDFLDIKSAYAEVTRSIGSVVVFDQIVPNTGNYVIIYGVLWPNNYYTVELSLVSDPDIKDSVNFNTF